MKRPAARKKKGKNTVARARLLENAINALNMLDFQIFKNTREYERAGFFLPSRYVILNYPHPSLYNTPGKKEAFIHDCGREFIFEAKLQNSSGSTDEKLPYLIEAFLVSPVPDWIVWFDGNFWTKNSRGLKAIEWLRRHAPTRTPEGRCFYVCGTNDEWNALAKRLFRQERAAA